MVEPHSTGWVPTGFDASLKHGKGVGVITSGNAVVDDVGCVILDVGDDYQQD